MPADDLIIINYELNWITSNQLLGKRVNRRKQNLVTNFIILIIITSSKEPIDHN